MPLFVRKAGVWHAATAFVRKAGVWSGAATSSVHKSGSWHTVTVPLTATCSPSTANKFQSGSSPATLTTNFVTVTPHGGTGPYTYLWTRQSGSVAINVSGSTSATVSFSSTNNPTDDFVAFWLCTVTDSLGATATVLVRVETDLEP